MIEHIISIIAPHLCIVCGSESGLLCVTCTATLPATPHSCYRCGKRTATGVCTSCSLLTPLRTVYISTKYEGAAKELVQNLKFGRAKAAAIPIASCMAARIKKDVQACLIVPVPTAPKRARQRGYDQAEVIAKRLARLTGFTYAPLLSRMGSQRQLGQDRDKRLSQMRQAYRVKRTFAPQSTILLIDDVITTGSTLESAAETLHSAGASHICAAVFAAA